MKILIVDDRAMNLKVLRAQLDSEGHAVVEAADGVEALAALEREAVDVVISDILMPRMDGYRLCHEVRKQERFRRLPFIFYTATYTSASDEKLCYDIGADKYLRKPASTADILAAVREAAARDDRPPPAVAGEGEMLREYNEVLVNKLEEKNLDLQKAVQRLEASEVELRQLSRVQAMLSGINALIVRARSRAELFHDACRIAIEQGGFRLAWIAQLDGDEAVPVAFQGNDKGLMRGLRFSLRLDGPNGRGPTARAMREGRPCVVNNVFEDAGINPALIEVAQKLGIRAFIALPLTVKGVIVGSLGLYAAEEDFFDDEEVRLLTELAGNISYAKEFILREEQLGSLAIYDPLTQLPNRTFFLRRLAGYVEDARERTRRVAVLMLDVERFKSLNDLLGQAGGDDLLKRLADRLKYVAGGPSYAARIAGDRFAAVLPGLAADADVADVVLARDWRRLGEPMLVGDLPVNLRVGLSVYPDDAEDGEALLRNAEVALKRARESGVQHVRYTRAMGAESSARLKREAQLRRALARDEFRLHYQPKVALDTGRMVGAEALIRWAMPEGELVLPEQFIPLLEESELILEVGEWVLGRALADHAEWTRGGLAVPRLSVNVSQAQLRQPGFAGLVRDALARHGVAGAALELEITETMLMADHSAADDKLRALRELGVTVALDDFGTGYSSLGTLARLPIDSLKIDRAFVAGVPDRADSAAIVHAVVSLARSMKLKVVAEGVETEAQLYFLRQLKCDEIQGFLYSRPLAAPDFARMLREGRTLAGAP